MTEQLGTKDPFSEVRRFVERMEEFYRSNGDKGVEHQAIIGPNGWNYLYAYPADVEPEKESGGTVDTL